MAKDTLSVGKFLKGYELRELVGQGGHGIVYRAYQPVIEREVVVKMIRAEYANHPEFIRRFDSEAQVIARLEHLHIVPLYDFWREPDSAYLVMRWMRGGSLSNSLKNHGPWSIRASARLLEQLTSALNIAHRNLIVHRDLKPDNILLDEENNAYLADFGIAKDIRPNLDVAEQPSLVGSPAYMSPEQFLEQPVSQQTDIYSLGIVLYELLTGRPPFSAESLPELAYMHIRDVVPPLQKYQPTLPTSLNLIISRATAKKPEERYPDALSFSRAFRQFANETEVRPAIYQVATTRHSNTDIQTLVLADALALENPYKGLRAFQEGDAADFFGREKLIEYLLTGFTKTKLEKRFLALVGPSGSGKSSILRAGLVPRLRRGALKGSQKWFYSQIVPGSSPLTNLTDALLSIASNQPQNLSQQLRQSEDGLLNLVKLLIPGDQSEYCLVIDQFEEVFTLVEDEAERLWFLNSLYNAVTSPNSRIRVLVSLRADFYDRPLLYSGFSNLMRSGTEVVVPLQAQELEYAVVGPARRFHLQFEPGLVSRIIADVNSQPGSLPLLQYALTVLFERRQERMLTNAAYEAINGVGGALGRRAEELYLEVALVGQEAIQKMMLRLVQISEDGEPTRRRVLQEELLALPGDRQVMRQVMERFGNSRLVTFDYHPHSRAPTIELAHEALIFAWDRLKIWIDENADLLRIQRQIGIAAHEWEQSGRERSFLVSGARLVQFETLCDAPHITLSAAEQDFLTGSIQLRQIGLRRLRLFITSLIVAFILTFALSLFAFQQRAEADASRLQANQQAQMSRSRELAATALSHLDQLDLSLLLSIEALNVNDTFEARSSLLTALQSQPMIEAFLPSNEAVRAVAFSPNGQLMAEGGRGNTITLWDVDTRIPVGVPLRGHTDWVNSLAFSPDGRLLASASSDGTVRLWNVNTGLMVGQPLGDGQGGIWAVAFSPDGTLASAGTDGIIQLWDVKTGRLKSPPLTGHEDVIYSLAFSSDGQLLASGGADTTVRLWDPAGGELLHTFNHHDNWVFSVAFSPDSQSLVSGGIDETLMIWDVHTYALMSQIASGHTNYVRSVAYSPGGQVIASASQDGTIRLWDARTNMLIGSPLTGHQDAVWSIAFRPTTSQTLASGGMDGNTILWNFQADPPLAQTRISSTEPVSSLIFARDHLIYSSGNVTAGANENTGIHLWSVQQGEEQAVLNGQGRIITDMAYNALQNKLVSSSTDGTLFLWDLQTLFPLGAPFAQETNSVSAVAFSPDGRLIVSGDQRGTIHLWDTATGASYGEALLGHEDEILGLAFTPDGQTLASASRDSTIRLWTIGDDQADVHVLEGHQDGVSSVSFSPDGQLLVSGSYDGTVRLWDVQTDQALGQPLIGHTDEVWSVAFSPDGQTIASGGRDKTLRLWDVATHQLLGRPILAHSDWITRLAFSSDGKFLATSSVDSSVLLWNINLNSWVERACQISNRNLSSEEWGRYFADTPFHETCSAANSVNSS